MWDIHQNGGHGSVGYQYEWSEEETRKNILRTHTTAVSARMLYRMAQDYKSTGVFTPKKYFSIDRVFRCPNAAPTPPLHVGELLCGRCGNEFDGPHLAPAWQE